MFIIYPYLGKVQFTIEMCIRSVQTSKRSRKQTRRFGNDVELQNEKEYF